MVASPVGANELAVRRFNGIEARSLDDWIQGLSQVIAEAPSKRSVRGAAGRTAVKTHYSFDAWKSQWCNAMGVTAGDRR
jgi:hypothetical protein